MAPVQTFYPDDIHVRVEPISPAALTVETYLLLLKMCGAILTSMSISGSLKCVAVLLPLLAISSAEAATINASLFTQSYRDQVAVWLGSDVTFTSIYSQNVGDDSVTWHAAVDGNGATVTLIQTSLGLIGGYDPQSWSSLGDYNITPPGDRTAFIFNLSTSLLLPQAFSDGGADQTYNYDRYGPTFGGGHDIYVDWSLASGYAYAYSYGNGGNVFGGSYDEFSISKIETFTVSPASPAPEPSTWILMVSSVGALFLSRRKLRASVPLT
ncbi:MAG: hypothetical protein JWN34_3256 [Bryobacterales bacterium]|nr:hypothetical protein [Bryobacterales bacterium]